MTSSGRILFLVGQIARAAEHVFELAALEGDHLDADFLGEALVFDRGHDDADRPGEGGVVRDDVARAARDVVAAARGERAHVGHDGLLPVVAELPQGLVDDVAGGDFAAGRIDVEDDGFDLRIVRRLLELDLDVVDGGVAETARLVPLIKPRR
jgi:hypothetical protein